MLTFHIKNAEPSSHVVLNNYSPMVGTHSDVTFSRLYYGQPCFHLPRYRVPLVGLFPGRQKDTEPRKDKTVKRK